MADSERLVLDSNQIAQILPHRYPFALVDRITDGEVGSWARGQLCVSVMSPVFCGHFPQYHVLPGVLTVEALAQTAAVAVLAAPENRGKLGFFAQIKDARFKRQVRPGDVLELEARIVRTRGSFAFVEGTARVDGKVATTAELTLALGSGENGQ
ncbi:MULTISPECIES: 3-hydroxyacyl-ACP dehydratase FabZ [Collinsella]|uniref:3-hydroxyacyl-ACP dehydratase FabZ n=1 Tax=Collinsella TaxID=102106 RepID=UPI000B39A10B|nr:MULTISPECIES: 3-hydroxyacyl-ACP dehydratase FabZ [Collinsella]MBM6682765.1 3-hydroxyacyl-ACP dehydratase FabZ [Collinsella intestinalis]OUN46344.1 3-hydroxyacyl-[acyl-carrier-protein] dehydratase FabZ [Collinsella sp. An7]